MKRIAACIALLVALYCLGDYVADEYQTANHAAENIRRGSEELSLATDTGDFRAFNQTIADGKEHAQHQEIELVVGLAFLVAGLALLYKPRSAQPQPEAA